MKIVYFEAQTGLIRYRLPANTNFYQYKIPTHLTDFLVSMVGRVKVSEDGSLEYQTDDLKKLSLIDQRVADNPEFFCNYDGVSPTLLTEISVLLSDYGFFTVLKAISLENERRAFLADTDEKMQVALKLVKLIKKCLEEMQ